MTTFNASAVDNATIGHRKGISLQTGRALRDNPIAISEADASVPLGLLPTVLLGTLTTTSGTTQTLSGLVLTPYKFLKVVVNGVSFSSSQALVQNSRTISPLSGGGSSSIRGHIEIDLGTGVLVSSISPVAPGSATGDLTSQISSASGMTTASTTLSFSATSGDIFDAGSITVYGVK